MQTDRPTKSSSITVQHTDAFLIEQLRRLGIRLQLVIFIANVNPLVFHDVLQQQRHIASHTKHSNRQHLKPFECT